MRIRKHASKLLGSAPIVFPSPPQLSNPWSAPGDESDAAAAVLCELNCSPWDVIMMPNYGHTSSKEEEEEEKGSSIGNDIKAEEEHMTATLSTAAELTIKKMENETEKGLEERKVKKVKQKKREEKEIKKCVATAAEIIMNCKKSDGKGWQCKKPAHPQHSLCHYHLTQLRSYNYNHSQKVSDAAAAAQGRNQRTKASATVAEAAGAGSNFYYYYCGSGPWRGKRRGGGEEEESRETAGYDAPMDSDDLAGDDEYDLHRLDEDDDVGDDSLDDQSYVENTKKEEDQEKRRLLKKRGRKPVKARSLKSLL